MFKNSNLNKYFKFTKLNQKWGNGLIKFMGSRDYSSGIQKLRNIHMIKEYKLGNGEYINIIKLYENKRPDSQPDSFIKMGDNIVEFSQNIPTKPENTLDYKYKTTMAEINVHGINLNKAEYLHSDPHMCKYGSFDEISKIIKQQIIGEEIHKSFKRNENYGMSNNKYKIMVWRMGEGDFINYCARGNNIKDAIYFTDIGSLFVDILSNNTSKYMTYETIKGIAYVILFCGIIIFSPNVGY